VSTPPSAAPGAQPILRFVGEARLPSGSFSSDIGIDAAREHVYVLSLDGLLVTVDARTNTVLATLNVGVLADRLAVDSVSGRVYVYVTKDASNSSGGSLAVVDGQTNALISLVAPTDKERFGTWAIGVNEVTSRVYVGDANSMVTVVNGATSKILESVNVGGQPIAIAIDVARNRVFVATAGLVNGVAVIDGTTNTVIKRFEGGDSPRAIAVNPATERLYLATGMETLTVLGEADGRILKTMTVMNRPERIAIDPRANRIYVANAGAGTLSVIDARTDEIIAQPIVAEAMGFGLALDSRYGRLYIVERIAITASLKALE
jgi:YVTN family beta-propeller protein